MVEKIKTKDEIENSVGAHLPYKRFLSTDSLLAKKDGYLFGYVQCDLVVSDELKSNFPTYLQFSKHRNGKKHFWSPHGNYAIEKETLKHPQRRLISSFKLENETVVIALFSNLIENVSTNSYDQWLMLEEEEMKPSIRSCSRNNETFG